MLKGYMLICRNAKGIHGQRKVRNLCNRVYHTSVVTDGGRGANFPLGKLNVKTGLPLNVYFGFSILMVFSTLLFLCVFRITLR